MADEKRERVQATLLLKAALEFNSNIIMIATTTLVTGKKTNLQTLKLNLKENLKLYKETLENIFNSEL